MTTPRFDVWICQGRMCTSFGADPLFQAARHRVQGRTDASRCRLLRGGCYGLCELAPNVVVRRVDADAPLPGVGTDRLTLTEADNEVVYSFVTPHDLAPLLSSHLDDDAPLVAVTRRVRETERAPRASIASRIRALRTRRRSLGDDE